jgi:hypothetical protein
MNQIWMILYGSILLLFIFLFVWKILTHFNKKLDSITLFQTAALWSLSFLLGLLLVHLFKAQPQNLGWAYRLGLFGLGGLATWGLFRLDWVRRDLFHAEKDSFANEFIFMGLVGCGMVVLMSIAPILVGMATRLEMQQWFQGATFWDAGLCVLLPFLLAKITDSISQIPYHTLENRWTYPMTKVPMEWSEPISARINFEMVPNAASEYRFWTSTIQTGVEVPATQTLGDVFCICVQGRQEDGRLPILEDLQAPHGERPLYWLSFRLKQFGHPLLLTAPYLNPKDSIQSLGLRPDEVIRVERIPFEA